MLNGVDFYITILNYGIISYLKNINLLLEYYVADLIKKLSEKPRLRLALNTVLTIVIGVLSSILASQIMPEGKLTWSLLPQVLSFWILLVVSILWFWIQCSLLNYDEDVAKFSDDAHCKAHMRRTQLEGIAQMIKNDPTQANLIDCKEFLKKMGVK